MRSIAFIILTVVLAPAALAMGAPKPAAVQPIHYWTVDVEYEHLQQKTLRTDSGVKRFWYIIITVTNNTGRDVDFYPQCEMMTDTFQILPAGQSVLPSVYEQIKSRYQRAYPFLEVLDTAGSSILQGEDNTRDFLIVWPDFDTKAKGVSLFITGLSNETAVIENPAVTDEDGNPTRAFLRKTLELDYTFGGDPTFRSNPKKAFTAQTWIMR